MSNTIQPRLQYSYAQINTSTGECISCMTCSYVINNPAWILIPYYHDDYIGKYYNAENGLWYLEPEHITQWEFSL